MLFRSVEVAGKALLDHVLDRLRAAGVERVVVNVHYLADALEAHLKARVKDLDVAVSDERAQLLETGGGLVRARPLIDCDPFLAVNSDNFWVDGPTDAIRQLAALKGLMVDRSYTIDWGHPVDSNDLIFVADPQTCDLIAQFDQVVTLDKFGAGAGVLNGQVGRVLGSPLISTLAVGLTNTAGKISNTAGNNVKGQLVAFNRNAFKVGIRKDITLELERMPGMQQSRLVASFRLGLGRYAPSGSVGSIEGAAVLYNITV